MVIGKNAEEKKPIGDIIRYLEELTLKQQQFLYWLYGAALLLKGRFALPQEVGFRQKHSQH